MRAEPLDDPQRISRYFRHLRLPYLSLVTVVQVLPPQPALRQSEQRPATLGTDLLVVATIRQLVAKSELTLDDGEIADHRHRGVRLPTATASRLFPTIPGVL